MNIHSMDTGSLKKLAEVAVWDFAKNEEVKFDIVPSVCFRTCPFMNCLFRILQQVLASPNQAGLLSIMTDR